MSRILCFSDIHIGFTGDGGVDKLLFMSFLDWARQEQFDKVVMVGDIIDLWRRDTFGISLSEYDVLYKLCELSKSVQMIYVTGNHDSRISKQNLNLSIYEYPFDIVSSLIIGDFKFMHGHQLEPILFNPASNDAQCLSNDYQGKTAQEIYKLIPGGIGFYPFAAGYLSKNDTLRAVIENNAMNVKKSNEYLIFGHTHVPFVDDDKKMANTGTWIEGRSDYIIIENEKVYLKSFSS